MVSERFGVHVKVGYSRKPNLKRYMASVGCSADGVRWAASGARAGLAGGRGEGRGARAGSGVRSAGERGREDEGEDESATRFATNADRNTLRVK